MYPSIAAIILGDPACRQVLGTNPTRFFPFGQAPQDPALSYAVWQTIYGTPENYLGNRPDIDHYGVQVDVYAKTGEEAWAIARALRDVLETKAHIVAWRGEDRDTATQLYHYSFDVDFWTNR